MAVYGLDIVQIMEWTYPQLRLLAKQRRYRIRDERRWSLMLVSGTLNPEMWDELWYTLGGVKLGLKSPEASEVATYQPVKGQHGVDEDGNVVAPGAPLLSDIALGKAVAPPLIPIKKIDKGGDKGD